MEFCESVAGDQCLKCSAGYFREGNTCRACAPDCELCVSLDYCYRCKSGDSFDGLCNGRLDVVYLSYVTAASCLVMLAIFILFKRRHWRSAVWGNPQRAQRENIRSAINWVKPHLRQSASKAVSWPSCTTTPTPPALQSIGAITTLVSTTFALNCPQKSWKLREKPAEPICSEQSDSVMLAFCRIPAIWPCVEVTPLSAALPAAHATSPTTPKSEIEN